VENWGYLSLIRRWWWTLLVATWVAGLLAFVVAIQIPPTFESRARLLVGPINTDLNTLRAGGQLVQTYAELVTSRPLLESTVEELGLDLDASDLEENVTASPDDVRRLLTIRVQSSDPDDAAAIANTLAQELIQLASGGAGPARPEGELSIIEFAEPSGSPVAPQVSLLVILAAIAGLLGALVLILLVEFFSDRIRGQGELAELARSPVLASVALPEGATGRQPTLLFEPPPGSVDFSLLATKIRATDDGAIRRLVVVGLKEADDAGAVAANLAAALAAQGTSAALIDAEGSARGITARLRLDDRPGLSSLIDHPRTTIDRFDLPAVRGVTVVPTGEEPVQVDSPAAAAAILDRIGAGHDVLVVHAAPAATSAAALSWASAADAVLLVVPADGGSRGPVIATADNLSVIGARLLGVVRLADRPTRRISSRRSAGGAEATTRASATAQATPAPESIGDRPAARRSRESAPRRR
jgi:polysaccharide biosynthesis transport protein